MIYAVLALIALSGVLLSALIVTIARAETRLDRVLGNHADERAKLLDRIQFPEVRQVEPGEVREYEPPTDSAELAQVGQIMFGNGSEG